MVDEVIRNEYDFKREAKKEWERAWKEDRAEIKERLETGGRRVPYPIWKVVEKVHQLGFNKGLAVKIEYEENRP